MDGVVSLRIGRHHAKEEVMSDTVELRLDEINVNEQARKQL